MSTGFLTGLNNRVKNATSSTLGQFNNSKFVRGTKSFLSSNSLVAKVVFLILVAIGFILLIRWGSQILTYVMAPKRSPKLISGMKPAEVAQAVDQSDVNAFKSVKGIGLKSAQRIIVDLKGKLDKIESNSDFLSPQGNTYKNEALSALVVLGIDKKKASNTIDEILKNNNVSSVEELIKMTLKAV